MTKSLKEITDVLQLNIPVKQEAVFAGVESDSRLVKDQFIYVAIKGYKTDGHQYIEAAIENGATAICIEEENYHAVKNNISPSIITIPYKNSRKALAYLSKLFYDNPSQKIKLIGVTGTNGKTTITYMIRAILQEAGKKVGLIGTICNYIGDKKIKSSVTTPDSLELNRLFDEMINQGVEYVMMEVSSHALYLDRVLGLEFDSIIFTNLSADHLDFHHDMEEYFRVKTLILDRLAESSKTKKLAILNHDIDLSRQLIAQAKNLKLKYKTYGLAKTSNYQGYDIHCTLSHNTFSIRNRANTVALKVFMPGQFNIYNTLASFALTKFLGINISAIESGLSKVSVPGRFQVKESPNQAYIIIDYAHTDDALRNVLNTIKELKPNRIITIFGCGGNRDKSKRSLMGAVSGNMSDITIVTSDNPRTEEPTQILDDIIRGVHITHGTYLTIENRYDAIKKGIEISQKNDVILIAGKGHEDYQILKDKTIQFDDHKVVDEIILNLF